MATTSSAWGTSLNPHLLLKVYHTRLSLTCLYKKKCYKRCFFSTEEVPHTSSVRRGCRKTQQPTGNISRSAVLLPAATPWEAESYGAASARARILRVKSEPTSLEMAYVRRGRHVRTCRWRTGVEQITGHGSIATSLHHAGHTTRPKQWDSRIPDQVRTCKEAVIDWLMYWLLKLLSWFINCGSTLCSVVWCDKIYSYFQSNYPFCIWC